MTSVVKTFRGVTYEVTLDATVSALTVHVAERLTGEVGDPPHPHLRQSFVFLFPPLPPFSPQCNHAYACLLTALPHVPSWNVPRTPGGKRLARTCLGRGEQNSVLSVNITRSLTPPPPCLPRSCGLAILARNI